MRFLSVAYNWFRIISHPILSITCFCSICLCCFEFQTCLVSSSVISVLAFWNFQHDNNERFDNDVPRRKYISVHEICSRMYSLPRTMNSCPKQIQQRFTVWCTVKYLANEIMAVPPCLTYHMSEEPEFDMNVQVARTQLNMGPWLTINPLIIFLIDYRTGFVVFASPTCRELNRYRKMGRGFPGECLSIFGCCVFSTFPANLFSFNLCAVRSISRSAEYINETIKLNFITIFAFILCCLLFLRYAMSSIVLTLLS